MAAAEGVIEEASVSLSSGGQFTRQAGAHPDLTFIVSTPVVERTGPSGPFLSPRESLRDVILDLPPGMVGNPTAAATCSQAALLNNGSISNCPTAAQVGLVNITPGIAHGSTGINEVPVFNMSHGPEVPAEFGFNYLGFPVIFAASVRPGDYGITSGSVGVPQAEPLVKVELTIWGVPGAPSHDLERVLPGEGQPSGKKIPFGAVVKPFLSNPTACTGAANTFVAHADTWQNPGVFDVRPLSADASGTPFAFEGCENLGFAPTVTAQPTATATEAPTGLGVDVKVPQNEGPGGLATSQVRTVSMKLPQGMTVSPSSAAGLGACAEGQVGIGDEAAPSCPESSKIGDVKIDTPLLEEELEGGMFLAKQKENPFGSLLALYLIVKGPGFWLKLPGKVETDPQTGQVTVTFSNTPQLPFEELQVDLKSGPAAPLKTPATCGTYAIQTEVTPWSGTAPVKGESKFTVSQNCSTGGFKPGFKAGTTNPQAGSFSSFTLEVTRNDGETNLSKISATLPPGLLAKLAGVPLCGDAEAASGNCPSGSQVGTTTIGAGPGPSLLYVPEAGKATTAVYLAGPYKGAPYSLVVKVPAQAGPFDLGTVVVRNALRIDPFTTQVTAESDPLPQILEGIPVTYRDVRVEMTRPQFTINPTNCSQFQVQSVLTSSGGQSSTPSAPFAAANCEALGFKPALKVQLKGQTKRTGHPALKAVLTYPKKGSFANIARAQVNLPGSEFLDQGNLDKTCTRPVLLEGKCPKTTVYGKAKAWSPLLDRPLEGPVYLVGGFGYKLPALVADLNGQIHVILKAKVDSGPNRGLRTTFEAVPDAPVSRFVLEMKGGKKYGLLINSQDICKGPQKLKGAFTAQNGKKVELDQGIAIGCGKKKRKARAS